MQCEASQKIGRKTPPPVGKFRRMDREARSLVNQGGSKGVYKLYSTELTSADLPRDCPQDTAAGWIFHNN